MRNYLIFQLDWVDWLHGWICVRSWWSFFCRRSCSGPCPEWRCCRCDGLLSRKSCFGKNAYSWIALYDRHHFFGHRRGRVLRGRCFKDCQWSTLANWCRRLGYACCTCARRPVVWDLVRCVFGGAHRSSNHGDNCTPASCSFYVGWYLVRMIVTIKLIPLAMNFSHMKNMR